MLQLPLSGLPLSLPISSNKDCLTLVSMHHQDVARDKLDEAQVSSCVSGIIWAHSGHFLVHRGAYLIIKFLEPAGLQKPKSSKTKVILSSHDYEGTPADEALNAKIQEMFAAGADIAKIATTAQDISDAIRMLRLPAKSEGAYLKPIRPRTFVLMPRAS